MGLVDYSDSESDTEIVAKPAPPKQQPTAGGSKKPFQKVIDRSKSGKILVNLPGSSSGRDDSNAATGADEPPAKRARISKGGAFSGFNSFLPPPKNVGKKPAASTAGSSSSNGGATKGANAPRPGVHLKTGAAPGFIRGGYDDPDGDVGGEEGPAAGGSGKAQQPTIPAGQKPAEEVELVGKPLMFRPLSVSRKKPTKKAVSKATATIPTTSGSAAAAAAAAASTPAQTIPTVPAPAATASAEPPPKKKKISLFSIPDKPTDGPAELGDGSSGSGAYEPLIDTDEASTADAFAAYDAQYRSYAAPAPAPPSSGTAAPESLDSIASGMNLSAAARRELFGRRGVPPGGGGGGGGGTGATTTTTTRVISFDTEKEYAHNEALRASGEQQAHNPLRAIAPGKHSLRQLVAQVQNQRDALEESFAKGKAKQGDAASRYGWR
ncbi:putative mitotic checkpoint protein prcc protein [Rosellinia necatrix]|uniref:Putative mitotic checkpoint protein prcc protein n=1 Tax=Rosellinia necatrix TaxID=77044 RepID=A0A1W2TLU3_ROSNE|nr:putative mitotic checkpoint protein prcc protein [Rosellinia necatrix]